MKTTIILLALLLSFFPVYGTGDAENNGPDHIAPDFLAAFYDHYTVNLLNARALGMGSTAVVLQGGIENAFFNPAALKADRFEFYIEANTKGSVTEMNRYESAEDPQLAFERQTLEQGVPSGIFGLAFSPLPNLSLGTSVSLPKTIRYNLLARQLHTGAFLDRFPEMKNYQTTFTLAGHLEPVNLGLNVIYNYYTFRDLRLDAPHFDRIRFEHGVMRIQPGVYYTNGKFSLGASYKFAAEETIKMGNVEPYYQIYDTHFPAVFETGVSYSYGEDILLALAFEYEQTSKQYEGFDDRLKLKLGFEKQFEDYDLRAGLVRIPGIYKGTFAIPEDDTVPGTPIYDPIPYDYGIVENTDQLLLTGGLSYYFRDVDLNIAIAKDIQQNFDLFQVVASMNVRLGDIIVRGKPGN